MHDTETTTTDSESVRPMRPATEVISHKRNTQSRLCQAGCTFRRTYHVSYVVDCCVLREFCVMTMRLLSTALVLLALLAQLEAVNGAVNLDVGVLSGLNKTGLKKLLSYVNAPCPKCSKTELLAAVMAHKAAIESFLTQEDAAKVKAANKQKVKEAAALGKKAKATSTPETSATEPAAACGLTPPVDGDIPCGGTTAEPSGMPAAPVAANPATSAKKGGSKKASNRGATGAGAQATAVPEAAAASMPASVGADALAEDSQAATPVPEVVMDEVQANAVEL